MKSKYKKKANRKSNNKDNKKIKKNNNLEMISQYKKMIKMRFMPVNLLLKSILLKY